MTTTVAPPKLVERTAADQAAKNLELLKRRDEAVSEILATCTHVVIYVFDDVAKAWKRKDIEGSLFVVKRSFGCRFRLVVLNRVSTQDLEQDLTGSFTFEDMPPYLLYRTTNESGEVETRAIWFHNDKEKAMLVSCLGRVLRLLQGVHGQAQQQQSTPTASPGRVRTQAGATATAGMQRGGGVEADTAREGPSASVGVGSGKEGAGRPVSVMDLLLRANGPPQQQQQLTTTTVTLSSTGGAGTLDPTWASLLLKPDVLRTQGGQEQRAGTLLSPETLVASTAPAHTNGGGSASQGGGGGAVRSPLSPAAALLSLDKSQLKAALLELLDDDAFIDSLHQAYAAAMKRR